VKNDVGRNSAERISGAECATESLQLEKRIKLSLTIKNTFH
jgi:hypothetical protein